MSRVKLGDVAFERKETCKEGKEQYPIVGLEHLIPDQINLTEWSDDPETTFTKFFHKGDVLFGRRRAYLRKAVIAPVDGICSGDITVISAIDGKIAPELLPHIVQNEAFFDFAVGKSDGSLSPRVKWDKLAKYEFELPSLDEQKKLAEVLWSMVETKEAYHDLLQKTDDIVKSQFIEMFGNMSDAIVTLETTTLGTVCDVRDGTHDTPKYHDDGYPLVTSKNVTAGYLDFSGCNLISKEDYEKIIKRSRVDRGDIIMPMIGTVGKPVIVETDREFAIKNVALIKFIPDSKVTNVFVKYLLESDYFDRTVMEKVQGGNQKFISLGDLRGLPLVIPNLDTQERFGMFVEQSDKSKFALQQSLDALNRTYKKIIAENLG